MNFRFERSDLAGLLLLMAVALGLRLPNLNTYTVSLPEGIRVEQLKLLSAGYQACEDVFCNQGPLALQVMHPFFVLFGQSLAAARSSAIVGSLVGLVAVYWIARQLWDRPTALLAGLLLAVSPTYLKDSRLAIPEPIALAPALLAIGAALRYQRGGGQAWLLATSVLYGLSLLIKPVALPAIVPIAILSGRRLGVRRRDLALAGGVAAGVVFLGSAAVGLGRVWEQIVFRWESRLAEGQGPAFNWGLIVDELKNDQLGLFLLAAAGLFLLARGSRPTLALVGGWAAASLALLLIHTPLRDKHVVIMLPPIALLASCGLASLLCWAAAMLRSRKLMLAPSLIPAALGALAWVVTLPGLAAHDYGLATASEMLEHDPAQFWYTDATTALSMTTRPDAFVVTDFPYLAFAADRLVPPQLVEASLTRIRAGSLTDEIAIGEASRFDPQAILLWWDRLTRLPGFKRWVDQRYQVVRVYAADREAVTSLYLPNSADLAPLRGRLSADATNASGARFGNGLVLSAWGLDSFEAAPGEQRSLTFAWQATERLGPNLAAIMTLRSEDRVVWTSQRLPLLGTGDGQRGWPPGRWLIWSGLVAIPPKLAPGSYVLSVRVAEGESGDLLPVQVADRPRLAADDPKGLELAAIEVSGPTGRKRS